MVCRLVIGLPGCLLSSTSLLFNDADGARDNPANKSFPDDAIATNIIIMIDASGARMNRRPAWTGSSLFVSNTRTRSLSFPALETSEI
jgi:hypothetical protein